MANVVSGIFNVAGRFIARLVGDGEPVVVSFLSGCIRFFSLGCRFRPSLFVYKVYKLGIKKT